MALITSQNPNGNVTDLVNALAAMQRAADDRRATYAGNAQQAMSNAAQTTAGIANAKTAAGASMANAALQAGVGMAQMKARKQEANQQLGLQREQMQMRQLSEREALAEQLRRNEADNARAYRIAEMQQMRQTEAAKENQQLAAMEREKQNEQQRELERIRNENELARQRERDANARALAQDQARWAIEGKQAAMDTALPFKAAELYAAQMTPEQQRAVMAFMPENIRAMAERAQPKPVAQPEEPGIWQGLVDWFTGNQRQQQQQQQQQPQNLLTFDNQAMPQQFYEAQSW